MDTHDVSSSKEYIKMLDRQRGVLQAARARQGERPKDRRTRMELVNSFMIQHAIQQMEGSKAAGATIMIQSSFIPPPYPPSTAPLNELTKTFIKDLKLETHHRGNYLLVRSITPPNKMTAVMAIVEDERGDAMILQIYQQDLKNDRPTTSVIKQDDIFVVKESYFKVMADGEYGLRIDHVSDLVRVEARNEKLPAQWGSRVVDLEKTANDWKLEGNDAMKRQQYWIAIESYTAALACPTSSQEEKIVKLNRALAYLKEECFDAALADTECLTSSSDAPEKALYRAGQALYNQGRFSDCRDILALLCKKYSNNTDATKELSRVSRRLEEQRSGTYDFKAIYKEASKLRPPHLDHATFTGPVTVKVSKGRGRGLFTTKAVKAGDLLLCEKAFAHCYACTDEDEPVNSSKISLLMNLQTNRISMGAQSDLITEIVQKLLRNPSCLPQFTALHHGSYKPVDVSEVDGKPVIDTFLVEQIISLNAFGCPLTTRSSHLNTRQAEKPQHHSCGIWLTASTINHSCLSNARRSFIGDLQLVHATRDLAADTELTFWYHVPVMGSGHHADMQESLRPWGFECDCAICVDAASTPKKTRTRRDALRADLESVLLLLLGESAGAADAPRAERLLLALERTYRAPPSEVPRLTLWDPYLFLARFYAARDQPAKAVAMALKMLESLGFVVKGLRFPVSLSGAAFEVERWGVMKDSVVQAWILLCNAYAAFAPQMARKARECARVSYRICVGEDVTFDESYS